MDNSAMSEENYESVDVSDMIEDTEAFVDNSIQDASETDTDHGETSINHDSELNNSENTSISEVKSNVARSDVKFTKLPISKIKSIMRMDPDVNVLNGDSVFLIAKATELFLETLAKETYTAMPLKKRKMITKKYLDHVIGEVDPLCFLEGALDF